MNVDDYARRCVKRLEPPPEPEEDAEFAVEVWIDMLRACRKVVPDFLDRGGLFQKHEELLAIYLKRGANEFADMERRFIEGIQERLAIWGALEVFFDAEEEAEREAAVRHFNTLTEQHPDQLEAFFIRLPAYYPENALPEYVRYCEVFNRNLSN